MIWEMRNDGIGTYAVLGSPLDDLMADETFSVNGKEKFWSKPPQVMPVPERKGRKIKPRADISHLWLGSIIFNQNSFNVLHEFLANFGQLLVLDCDGEPEYFYNVTNILPGIDLQASEFQNGILKKEKFQASFLNDAAPIIFKDPQTVATRIYANDCAKKLLEDKLHMYKLTGLKFSEPGAKPY